MTEETEAQREPTLTELFCPLCGKQSVDATSEAFIEAGEWDGKAYESEGPVTEHTCRNCGNTFYQ